MGNVENINVKDSRLTKLMKWLMKSYFYGFVARTIAFW